MTKNFLWEHWTLQASLATKSAYRRLCLSHFIVFLFSYHLVALKPQCNVFPAGAFCSSQIIQGILLFTAVFYLPFLSSGLFPFTDFILNLPTNVTNITRNGKEEFCPCFLLLLLMGKAKDSFYTNAWLPFYPFNTFKTIQTFWCLTWWMAL